MNPYAESQMPTDGSVPVSPGFDIPDEQAAPDLQALEAQLQSLDPDTRKALEVWAERQYVQPAKAGIQSAYDKQLAEANARSQRLEEQVAALSASNRTITSSLPQLLRQFGVADADIPKEIAPLQVAATSAATRSQGALRQQRDGLVSSIAEQEALHVEYIDSLAKGNAQYGIPALPENASAALKNDPDIQAQFDRFKNVMELDIRAGGGVQGQSPHARQAYIEHQKLQEIAKAKDTALRLRLAQMPSQNLRSTVQQNQVVNQNRGVQSLGQGGAASTLDPESIMQAVQQRFIQANPGMPPDKVVSTFANEIYDEWDAKYQQSKSTR